MSGDRRAVTFMVHRDGDLTSRSLRVPVWLLRTALISASVVAGIILLSLALYAPIVRTAARVPGLNREVARLQQENAQVRTLAATLQEVEASYDLYATPWRTFRQVTLPALLPAIVAGFLLAFTFSFDDYVITSFVSGPGSSTLPLFIFGQIKRGVTPETNAVATMILLFTIGILLFGQVLLAWSARRRGGSGDSMAAIVAQQR